MKSTFLQEVIQKNLLTKLQEIAQLPMLLLLALTMLLPYQPNHFKVRIAEPITTETQTVALELQNRTNREIWYRCSAEYYEKKTPNGWERLADPPLEEPVETDDCFAHGIRAWGTETFRFSPQKSFRSPMDPGTYRFVLRYCLNEDELNDPNGKTASVFYYEFQVEQG